MFDDSFDNPIYRSRYTIIHTTGVCLDNYSLRYEDHNCKLVEIKDKKEAISILETVLERMKHFDYS